MKKILLILVVIIAYTSCNSQVSKKINVIDLQTLKKEVVGKDVQFIDVRTEKEYDAGHIDDAVNINVSNEAVFKKKIQELDKHKPVYIYCHSGGRSNKASKIMEELGFTSIYDFSGGWSTWSQQ
jgi:rhodanese-related sulfurtransferase